MNSVNLFLYFLGLTLVGPLVWSRTMNLLLAIVGFKDGKEPLPKDSIFLKQKVATTVVICAIWIAFFGWLGLALSEQNYTVDWQWLVWGVTSTPSILALLALFMWRKERREEEKSSGVRKGDA